MYWLGNITQFGLSYVGTGYGAPFQVEEASPEVCVEENFPVCKHLPHKTLQPKPIYMGDGTY